MSVKNVLKFRSVKSETFWYKDFCTCVLFYDMNIPIKSTFGKFDGETGKLSKNTTVQLSKSRTVQLSKSHTVQLSNFFLINLKVRGHTVQLSKKFTAIQYNCQKNLKWFLQENFPICRAWWWYKIVNKAHSHTVQLSNYISNVS